MATDPDTPVERLLDVAVYLPIGVYLDSKGRLDELTERGRQHATSQIQLARMVGQFAVSIGRKELERRLADLITSTASGGSRGSGSAPGGPGADGSAPSGPGADGSGADGSVGDVVGGGAVAATGGRSRSRASGETSAAAPSGRAVSGGRASRQPASSRPRASSPRQATRPVGGRAVRPAVRPVLLPIDGYDTLAAAQIIARLDALAPAELEAVRRHESANRNRKTILGRIDQLTR